MSDIKTSDEELRSKVTETIRQVAWMWEPMARDLPESCTRDVEFIMSLIKSRDQQIALAYSGCTNCYGKGYATQSSRASGRGISWDTSGIKFCECPRGQQLKLETEQIALAAHKEGRRVGQYQAADKLYSYATMLWMFKEDNDKKTKAMNIERVEGLLKDCEKYLNHNRKVYVAYLATLKAQENPDA